MKRNLSPVLLLLVPLILCSCATIFCGTKAKVTIDGNVKDQPVQLSVGRKNYNDFLPTTVKVKRGGGDIYVSAKADGYKPYSFRINKKFNPISILNLGDPIAWIIDASTGSIKKPEKKYYYMSFTRKETIRPPEAPKQPAATTVIAQNIPANANRQEPDKAMSSAQSIPVNSNYTLDIDLNIPKSNTTNDNTYVMIISNEHYNKLAEVPYALRDGEVFSKYCNQSLGIPEENIKIYKDATFGDMLAAMEYMKSLASVVNDINIIVYYAGHGAPDDATKEAYLIPIDAYGVKPKICYALKDFYADLSGMNANKTIVFLDACFSGSARAEDGKMLASARGIAISSKKELLSGNLVVLSATDGSETALPYEKQQHGLFTYYLLKQLQETKGNTSMKQLVDYIKTNVSKQSVVINMKLQSPTINVSSSATGWENWMLNR
ncbi:MAG: caspase family protein [Bacteroides sp.]|nr:caspase family protein [Bacteroides sp.]MCM1085477.1 caspase family protein [Bacteroides sp.]